MIEVYWAPIPDEGAVNEVAGRVGILDAEESARYSRYRLHAKKVEFLTGRLLLKTLLAAKLGVRPEQIRFTKNQYGRPYLCPTHQQPALFFNLSHTSGIIACVVSPWPHVGIDVERPRPSQLEVLSTVFVPKEIDFINAQPSLPRQLSAFGLLWTRKEAVMKAEGMGFHLAPKSFTVPLGWGTASDDAYVYYSYQLGHGACCSLALARRDGIGESTPQLRRVAWTTFAVTDR